MCTLIVLQECVAGWPLIVAANRDEYLDRPAEGLALRELPGGPDESGRGATPQTGRSSRRVGLEGRAGEQRPGGLVVAPLDRRAGGTWLGVNAHGVFVAVTNRPCGAPDPARRSRGAVVFDALRESTAEAAAERLSALPAGVYNPFNAFCGDGVAAFATEYIEKPVVGALAAGVHVIGNAAPDDRSDPKVGRILAGAERAASAASGAVVASLQTLMSEHECGGARGPIDDTCVHAGPYGTRSSLLFERADHFLESRLRHADGAPCEASYQDFTPLLDALVSSSRDAGEAAATRTAS